MQKVSERNMQGFNKKYNNVFQYEENQTTTGKIWNVFQTRNRSQQNEQIN